MSTNYSLLFYLKKPKNYVGGMKPIYMRITVAGDPKEVSTGRECDPVRWNAKANRAKDTKEDIRGLNAYLDTLERKVADAHLQLVKDGTEITAESLKLKYLGKDVKRRYLMETFTEHNRKMEALLGKGFKPNTLKGYNTSVAHLTSYLEKCHGETDIEIRHIDHAFITGYEFFLRSDMECSAVSAAKYMKHLRKIINQCLAHRWITENPFVFYKTKAKPREKEFLTPDELDRIAQKEFSDVRGQQTPVIANPLKERAERVLGQFHRFTHCRYLPPSFS